RIVYCFLHNCYGRCSISSRAFLRSIPQRYPPIVPSSRTTRWHGMATATGLVAQARATALVALGCPIPFATSLYDRVAPNGIDCRYVQSGPWTAAAGFSRGRKDPELCLGW